jgi:hypothetical protein
MTLRQFQRQRTPNPTARPGDDCYCLSLDLHAISPKLLQRKSYIALLRNAPAASPTGKILL